MDLPDLLKLLIRRWYIPAPIMLLTICLALALGGAIQPEYRTAVAVLLVPPTASATPPAETTPQPGNPWLLVGEHALAQAVQTVLSSPDARTRIATAGGTTDYEVDLAERSAIITVEVTATTRRQAMATATGLTRLIRDEVAGQQERYRPKPGEQINAEVLGSGHDIVVSHSNALRLQLVVAALGLLLAITATVTAETIARRRATARLDARYTRALRAAHRTGQAVPVSRRPDAFPEPPPT